MEWLLGILGIVFGGGVTWLVFWKQSKNKLDGEAKQAQAQAEQMTAQAAEKWFGVFENALDRSKQELSDKDDYIEELRSQRVELRKDRDELRQVNDELRKKLSALDEKVLQLEKDVARNGRMVEALRPFLCGRLDCKDRVKVETKAVRSSRSRTE